ncbi:hypothetical protein LEP1GSC005_2653 [Leptospira santarosai str. ST188]|nr:hypothetical protein LEP1GSC005_2653 [Leptospira santarosai str. ST188]
MQNLFQKIINSRLDTICKNFCIFPNQALIFALFLYEILLI